MKLFTFTFAGNLHETIMTINQMCPEIIPGIITMDCQRPYSYTIVVYREEHEHPKLARSDRRVSTPGDP